ncbi:unnamed protein product [Amaranthus hypochondriacus]
MYGDCQVALPSTMGGAGENGIPSTPDCSSLIFSSPMRNPNNNHLNSFSFMSSLPPTFHPFSSIMPVKEEIRGKEEMMESLSGSELNMEGQGGVSGNELDSISGDLLNQNQSQPPGSKKKRYHRHTIRQIQEMEALFRECPHPDDKQRMKLSQELGLKPRQVKFWFQNRRTQMKAQQDRTDNVILRAENDNLKNENYRLQAVLRSLICPGCGGSSILGEVEYDEHQLHIENARLKEELDRVCAVASRYTGRSLQTLGPPATLLQAPPSLDLDMGIYSRHFQDSIPPCTQLLAMPLLPSDYPNGGGNTGRGLIMDEERPLAMELAMSSMDELLKLCHTNEPLWIPNCSNTMDVLNIEEYSRMFTNWPPHHNGDPLKPHYSALRTEATRDKALVIMNSINLVDSLLDADKWVELFPSIVSRAKTIQILASGVSGHASGSLHLMYAELQVLSPLVPTRETYFLRYCHHNAEDGMWVVVDFPVDSFQGAFQLSQNNIPRYRRRPSGCIIQDMPNGYSKVTWIEHTEILGEKPIHQIFNLYVDNMMAFGAKRWLAVLQRQCERVASLMARNVSDHGVIQSAEARKNFMKLAQRMIRTLCVNISTSGGQSWTALSENAEDTVRITTRKIMEPGQPNGLILCAVTTTWLPYSHEQVFDLLKNEYRRSQLEALSNGSSLHEVAHIANGSHPGNSISLFRINMASNSSQNVELMLQESCTDASGSLVVYSTLEVDYIQLVMSGEDPSCIPLLPTGFSIIPLERTTSTPDANDSDTNNHHTTAGCLLTVGIQVHASAIPNAKLNLSSVNAINSHICSVVHQINVVLGNTNGSSNTNNNNINACVAATSND